MEKVDIFIYVRGTFSVLYIFSVDNNTMMYNIWCFLIWMQ